MKLNDGAKLNKAYYQLFIACCMLQAVKLSGRRQPHNYPKMQLSSLLVLKYWEKINHCTHEMMEEDTGFSNEELGEIGFSMLGRVCLGDHTKDDFTHMDQMYKLIRVYRDLKNEINTDNHITTSLSWRHRIDVNGEEVNNSKLFFQSCIRQVITGNWKSYSSNRTTYANIQKASTASNKEYVPLVYMTKQLLDVYVTKTYQILDTDLHGYFVYPYVDIFPEAQPEPIDESDDFTLSSGDLDSGSDILARSIDDSVVMDSMSASISSISFNYSDVDDGKITDSVDEGDSSQDDIERQNPHLNRSWNAWGAISNENEIIGRRKRIVPEIFSPSKRRFL